MKDFSDKITQGEILLNCAFAMAEYILRKLNTSSINTGDQITYMSFEEAQYPTDYLISMTVEQINNFEDRTQVN